MRKIWAEFPDKSKEGRASRAIQDGSLLQILSERWERPPQNPFRIGLLLLLDVFGQCDLNARALHPASAANHAAADFPFRDKDPLLVCSASHFVFLFLLLLFLVNQLLLIVLLPSSPPGVGLPPPPGVNPPPPEEPPRPLRQRRQADGGTLGGGARGQLRVLIPSLLLDRQSSPSSVLRGEP